MSAALKMKRSDDCHVSIDADEMVARARALVPVLASREAGALAARQIPPATMDDFRSSGLVRMLQPRRFGGLQGTVDLFSRIVEELAYGCASSAWVYSVFGEHAWIIASMPERGQRDVWGENPDAVASSSLAPRAIAKSVPGGYRVSGRYPFSSGCGHAQWAIVGAFCDEPGRDQRYMMVPMSEVEVIDDWEVVGLRASGSKTIVLHDAFIPDHRTALLSDMAKGNPPGRQAHPDYALLSAPRYYLCVYSQMAVALTLGRRAVDFVAATMQSRVSGGVRKVSDSEVVQLKFAQSAAEIDAATLIFRTGRQAATEKVEAGLPIPAEEVAARHRDVAFMHQLIRSAVERLCDISGTSWVYDSSPLQAMLRDVLTTTTHGVVNPQLAMVPYGRLVLTPAAATEH